MSWVVSSLFQEVFKLRPGNQNYGKAPCLEKMPPTVPSGLKMGAFQGWWRGCAVVGLALAWEAFGVEGNPSQTRSQAAGCAAALGHQRAPEAGICGLPGSSPRPPGLHRFPAENALCGSSSASCDLGARLQFRVHKRDGQTRNTIGGLHQWQGHRGRCVPGLPGFPISSRG